MIWEIVVLRVLAPLCLCVKSLRDRDWRSRWRTSDPHPGRTLDGFDFSALYNEYRDESEQQLSLLDAALLRLEESGELSEEERTALLRALHTLKGNSGMLGLQPVVEAVHTLENAFRSREVRWSRASIDAMFETAAALRRVAERLGTDRQDDAISRLAAINIGPPEPDPGAEDREEPDHRASQPTGSLMDQEGSADPVAEPGIERVEQISDTPPAAEQKTRNQKEPSSADPSGTGEVLRVPFQKLDTLLNRVGEIVTVGAALEELLDNYGPALEEIGARRPLEAQVESLQLISEGLREATMDLRLVTVGRVFQRFPSVARDLARAHGKQVRVVLEGEDEELDKSTVDALADPLLHLVRNAVDHGIGTPEERRAVGKPETGTITLRARRTGDRVQVEVSDDGAGLDRERILQRARREGLVGEHEELTVREIDELIFRTGFSTRSTATTISGRGVGLDVVQRRVRMLRGRLTVDEAPGGGTRFLLSLPLTLAIVPALIFEVDGEILALPATEVEETLRRVRPERAGGAEVLRHRDSLIPVARPGQLLGWNDRSGGMNGSVHGANGQEVAGGQVAEGEIAGERGERVVNDGAFAIVLRRGTRSAAVLADRLLEQREVVLKALPRSLGSVRGVSGATVTPGGRVVLVLDPGGLLDLNLDTHRKENRG